MNQAAAASQFRSYANEKVTFVYQKMIDDILKQQPQNVIDWSINWLNTKGRDIVKQREKELKKLQKKQKKGKVSSDSSSDDEIIELPKRPVHARQQRASISAEAYGTFNKKELFQPRVIPKDEELKQRIISRLNKSFMFAALDEREKDIVVNAMEEKHFKKDDWVIKQGESGDNLYVVDQGELDCYKRFPNTQEDTYLKVYKPGESFGELALLYNAPRAASIQSREDCTLFSLDRLTFNHIVKDAAMRKREKYVNVLKSIDLLSMMDPYERSHVADGIRSANFSAGECIIREGDQGDIFYMIEEGHLHATKTLSPGEEPVKVYEYKPGDYFGELALLRDVPRQANIIAQDDVKLVYLDRDCFKRLLGPLEEILKRNAEKYEKYEEFWRNQMK